MATNLLPSSIYCHICWCFRFLLVKNNKCNKCIIRKKYFHSVVLKIMWFFPLMMYLILLIYFFKIWILLSNQKKIILKTNNLTSTHVYCVRVGGLYIIIKDFLTWATNSVTCLRNETVSMVAWIVVDLILVYLKLLVSEPTH